MSAPAASHRIWLFDLARGVFIFTMMTAHSIFFFHISSNWALQAVNGLADFISFTALLCISGATAYIAYLDRDYPLTKILQRIGFRLPAYFIGYYALTTWILWLQGQLSSGTFISVITFQRLIPFTEYIATFLFYTAALVILRSAFRKLLTSLPLTLLAGASIYLIGAWGYSQITGIPLAWKAILVGHPGIYSFPVMQYAPVYLFGMIVGKLFVEDHSAKKQVIEHLAFITFLLSLIVTGLAVLANIPFTVLISRWPPSLAFILFGLSAVLTVFAAFIRLRQLERSPDLRYLLLILGQNSFALFLTHTLIVYTYQGLQFPKVYASLLVILLWLGSMVLAVFLAKILPINYRYGLTFIKWCQCHLDECIHHSKPTYLTRFSRFIHKTLFWPRHFSFPLGRRQINPFRRRTLGLSLMILLFTAAPLGIAENQVIIEKSISSLSGQLNRTWILADNTQENLTFSLELPSELNQAASNISYQYQISDLISGPLQLKGRLLSARLPVETLLPGDYQVFAQITVNGQNFTTQPLTFYVTKPLFVTWTIDWEGYDVKEEYLEALASLSAQYDIPMTHLFNPRVYSSPDISPARAESLTQWVKDRRDLHQEEIGLHLHMFPDFVARAGLTPRTTPAWGGGFSPGYDILTTAYPYTEMVQILTYAKEVFEQKGLGVPLMYRAGAWFANTDTLKALQDTGFLADTSGRTAYSFGSNHVPGPWDLTSTSQPYFPSIDNQNSAQPPHLSILEIPNNGADSYAFSGDQLVQRFNDNFDGKPLSEARQVTYLSHPHWFDAKKQAKMAQTFSHIQPYLYRNNTGPVVFTGLLEVAAAWRE